MLFNKIIVHSFAGGKYDYQSGINFCDEIIHDHSRHCIYIKPKHAKERYHSIRVRVRVQMCYSFG